MGIKENSYRSIFKATSIFGGVQLFNIVISIARSKVVAVLLGPAGVGIFSLYTTTIGLIAAATNFGLGTSAVKNVAAANEHGNAEELGKTVTVFRRLVWFTGGIGFVLTLVFAPVLSDFAFGNESKATGFIILSITLLLTQLSAGNNVILQGLRKIQYMAKAAMLGSLLGFLFSVPLYYFYAQEGIVLAILVTAIVTFFFGVAFR